MTVISFPRHKLHKCGPECEGCGICQGGLALCVTCRGAESSLPTDCPQRRMDCTEIEAVSDGTIDFRRGLGWHYAGSGLVVRPFDGVG